MIKTIKLLQSALDSIKELGYDYTTEDNTISVKLLDIDYDFDHYLIDPDKQLCFQYGIDYNYLISINWSFLVNNHSQSLLGC